MPYPTLDTLAAVRAEDRKLARLNLVLAATSLAFLAWLVVMVFILERRDTIYLLLTLFGSASGIGRFFIYKVRSVPEPLLRLAHGDEAGRDRAWALIEAHKAELCAMTNLPATTREPELVDLDREGLVERVRRHGTTNWRKALRVFLTVWAITLAVVLVAVLLHTPAPVIER